MLSDHDRDNSDTTPTPSIPSDTDHTASEPQSAAANPVFPLKRFLALVFAIGLLVMGMIIYSAETGLRMSQRYTPLIDAAMEIKQEATVGHLWFEEILSNDRSKDIDDVRTSLKQADWYAHAMLEGGQNTEGTFIALDDPELRLHITHVRERLVEFRKLLEHRWENYQTSAAGSQADQDFDQVFNEFIEEADFVETRLQQLIKAEEERFIFIQVGLALVTMAVMSVLGLLMTHFARSQNFAMAKLGEEIVRRQKIETTLREQATTDSLTGLLNRRSIRNVLHDELMRAARLDTSFSVVLFDIDHFKQINDTHGHGVGDDVLKTIASATKARLREVDALARWGGEEFLAILPGTTLDGAVALAEVCRNMLALQAIKDVGHVTASFGVAEYIDGERGRELIHRADEALYKAKHGGRNRVEASTS